uniref:helix-turn-helix domain-containing protein n=1 Tax=Castellaniella defragrans TaxID=75697 RepID=UPI003341CAAE
MMSVDTFAQRLSFARHTRGLSQAALARASGISQSAIASYENGTRKSTPKVFELAQALQVDPIWLGQGTGAMEPVPHTLGDVGGAWPFPGIAPRTYWALSAAERRAVEETVNAMIRSFRMARP